MTTSAFPVYTGDTHDGLACTWQRDDGTAVDITGATITFRWKKPDGTTVNGNGTVTVTNAASGQFTYAWGTIEQALAGNCLFQWKGVWGDGTILHMTPQYYEFDSPI